MVVPTDEPRGPDRRVGMTPEKIIDTAVRMSEGTGINSWKIRDLAAELDVTVSVIYHHVGGRDQVIRGVVEKVMSRRVSPDPSLEWKDWFRAFLHGGRPDLMRYPGIAKWLLMHGPVFSDVTRDFDAGMATLVRAGFEKPGIVYALIINSAMLTITMRDDRLEAGDDGPRDHGAMQRDFHALGDVSPGIRRMMTELLDPLASDPDGAGEAVNNVYYDMLVESLLAGLEARYLPDAST